MRGVVSAMSVISGVFSGFGFLFAFFTCLYALKQTDQKQMNKYLELTLASGSISLGLLLVFLFYNWEWLT